MELVPQIWVLQEPGETLAALIRRRHAGPIRVAERKYERAANVSGTTTSGTWYLTAGTCALLVSDRRVEIREGQAIDVPAGNYTIVVGDESLEMTCVWPLPPGFEE